VTKPKAGWLMDGAKTQTDDNELASEVIAEEEAFHKLRREGYKVLLRNYECPLGEVSLIAKHDGRLVFVGVNKAVSEKVVSYYVKRYGMSQVPIKLYRMNVVLVKDEKPLISMTEED